MDSENISREGARFYSHVLPSPQQQTLSSRRVVGRNWALVGDAAAWVDPITGEGLYYALRSGDVLAQSLIAGKASEIRPTSARRFRATWNLPRASPGGSIADASWAARWPRA